jgi:signal transduction histidine kinase
MLFILIVPALAYTTYYAGKSLLLSEQLRHSEEQRNSILARQNVKLEQMVQERTNEILSQNEEISAQNEEITAHNEQLVSQQEQIESQHFNLVRQHEELVQAKRIIEEQNRTIQLKNDALNTDVERQTHDLKQTNLELIEQNNRLEQFAYIISHNLRAPMARLVGLSVILDLAKNEEERANIVKLMVKSTHDLDQVIKDLSYILGISKLNTKVLHDTSLLALIEKVKTMLEGEIKETGAVIETDFSQVASVISLPQYLESIFYNLLSNSIKYRHPHKTPLIRVSSQQADEYIKIEVSDNGLGIDIDRYQATLFNLYKRFHFHVEGKGMGLYLVKTQVAALGGKIEVKSKLDVGTTFAIYLRNGTLPPRFISEGLDALQEE